MIKDLCFLTLIFCLSLYKVEAQTLAEYQAMAETAMTNHIIPVTFGSELREGGTVEMRPGTTQFFGCAVDDPWYHPYVDVFKGAEQGRDIYLTCDPSQEKPGENEVDVYVGSYRIFGPPQEGFYLGDKPGDIFILGNHEKPFYAGKENASDPEDDFVYIVRYEPYVSTIRLHGSPSDYVLAPANDPESPYNGTALFYIGNGTDDLIAHIDRTQYTNFDLNDPVQFEFATLANQTPAYSGGLQLGNGGIQIFGQSAIDNNGNIYITFLSSGPDFVNTQGTGSFYLAKYDSSGNQLWIRKHGNAVTEENRSELPYRIVANEQYVFISGHVKSPYGGVAPTPGGAIASRPFLGKYDANTGALLEVVQQMSQDFDGNGNSWSVTIDDTYVYVAGGTSENTAEILPDTSPFIYKYNIENLSVGPIWSDVLENGISFPDPDDSSTWQVSNEAIGGVSTYVDTNGDRFTYISGYGAVGEFLGGQQKITDAWTAKYDEDGNFLWGIAYQAPMDHQYAWTTATDNDGNVYVVGQTNGAMDNESYNGNGDGFLRKMAPDGTHLWTKLIGTEEADDIYDIKIHEGHIYIAGTTDGVMGGQNYGVNDGYVMKLDLDGNPIGVKQFGSERIDYARQVLIYNDTFYVTGITEGSMGGPSSGGVDVFMVSFLLSELDGNLSIDEFTSNTGFSFQMAPNPVSNEVTFSIENNTYGATTITIYDTAGRLVQQQTMLETSKTVNVANISAGMYYVKASHNNLSIVKPLIIH